MGGKREREREKKKNQIVLGKTSGALKEIMELVSFSNKLFDTYAPWQSFKTDLSLCEKQLFDISFLISNLALLLTPFLPSSSEIVLNFLGIKAEKFEPIFQNEICVQDVKPLFERLNFDDVKEKFSSFIS